MAGFVGVAVAEAVNVGTGGGVVVPFGMTIQGDALRGQPSQLREPFAQGNISPGE